MLHWCILFQPSQLYLLACIPDSTTRNPNHNPPNTHTRDRNQAEPSDAPFWFRAPHRSKAAPTSRASAERVVVCGPMPVAVLLASLVNRIRLVSNPTSAGYSPP